MPPSPQTLAPQLTRRVLRIQALTLLCLVVEAAGSLWAAGRAQSPALLGFAGDSAIEFLSALVVFRRVGHSSQQTRAEERAAKIAGALLFVLAALVALVSALALRGYLEPRPSPLGIGILILAAVLMPWFARQKRLLSAATGSAALRADAAESAVCGYLALITLAGLVVNRVWGITWADPLAALALLPLILREAWEAIQGRPCSDSR